MTIGQLEGLHSYWDARTGAIAHFSQEMRECASEQARKDLAERIARDVRARVDALSDKDLVLTAVTAADDLYKAADAAELWDPAIAGYLSASAGTFMRAVAERGYLVHSLIDNSFQMSEAGMRRPLVLYPDWFQAAGFVYICPQHCATTLMRKAGVPASGVIQALGRYDAPARILARGLVRKCHAERRHYVFLDACSVPGAFGEAEAPAEAPGVITLWRNDAPLPGSEIQVTLPQTASLPRTGAAPASRARAKRPRA